MSEVARSQQAETLLRLKHAFRILYSSSLVVESMSRGPAAERIQQADLRSELTLGDIAKIKEGMALLFIALGGLLGLYTHSITLAMVAGVGGGALGFILPDSQLAAAAKVRQRQISEALPLALEVIGLAAERTSVDSGLDYYCRYFADEVLAEEVTAALQRVTQMNERLDVAMGEMLRKNRNQDLSFLVAAINQSSQVGGQDLRKLLFDQAGQLRNKQALGVKARALRAPVMMTFPTMLNVLTLLILLGGLAVLQVSAAHK
ncbi:MAG: type II secretion system F family protein [Candidatus Dormibacteria bacterium]